MKRLALALLLATLAAPAAGGYGDVYVDGYTRDNGTYVRPHYRFAPDGNAYNNYGSRSGGGSYGLGSGSYGGGSYGLGDDDAINPRARTRRW